MPDGPAGSDTDESAAFDYVRAASTTEACALLTRHGPSARLLAGGQSLLPAMNLRLASPSVLIDIGRINSLDAIEAGADILRIGAMVRHRALTILRSTLIAEAVPLLTRAMATSPIRPSALGAPSGATWLMLTRRRNCQACMLALDAAIEATSSRGRRDDPAEDFFTGLFQTTLEPDEMLTAVEIPLPARRVSSRKSPGAAAITRSSGWRRRRILPVRLLLGWRPAGVIPRQCHFGPRPTR